MAKWISLPLDFPLQYNPYQDAFWKARRQRICRPCQVEFEATTSADCPKCGKRGVRKFHRLTLIAGRRGGKTRAASIALVEEAMIPNSIVWACAPTVPKLHRYVEPALQQIIPEAWVASYNNEFGDIRLKNGSLIHLQTLEHPDQGRGQGLDAVWVDEVSELSEEHWNVLRPSLTERRGAAIFSTSPRSFDWVYKKLYKPAQDGFVVQDDGSITPVEGFWACRYSTSENPIITSEEVAEAKATMSATMFRQEYEADFVSFTGAVYGEHLSEKHILRGDDEVRRFIPEWPQVDPSRPVLVGIDTGADHPFGAVKLISTPKGFVVVGEYLERERSFITHAQELKRLGGDKAHYAINKNDKQAAIELAQHKVYCAKAENDIIAGTERVKSWLHVDQLYFAASRVPRTLEQLQSYRWAENVAPDGQARKEKVFKKYDELPDALRYALMTWPALPKPIDAESTERDISALPEKVQADIIEMRKIERALEDKPAPTVSGDMWAETLDEYDNYTS